MDKAIRHSHQRDMIYNYLLSTKAHPTAEMVYGSLKGDIQNLSLGTVYRNLKLLESLGMVRRVTTPQNVERYDADVSDHAHFVCSSCGAVKDLFDINTESIKLMGSTACKDNIKWVNLTFGGICSECDAKYADTSGETI